MITVPDGFEVVATSKEAEKLDLPPLLVLEKLEKFFDDHNIGSGEFAWQRIGDGQSNITYLIERGEAQVVLRRGPRPPLPPSTHDMIRESRVQLGLAKVGSPVPKIIAVCEDESVLGVPFYVMNFISGVIIGDSTPQSFDTVPGRLAASEALVDTLASFPNLDLEQAGLQDFGRPDGYLERQIKTFTRLSDQVSERKIALVSELGTWLSENLPQTQKHSLVHGDYRFGNVMFTDEATPKVAAILDWEMATLGDPLADLGYLTATYSDPLSAQTVMELTPASTAEGYLTSAQLAERYASTTGLDVSSLPWYQTLALWKSSIFLEAIYTRFKRGERPDDQFAATLETEIPRLLEHARGLSAQNG